MTSSSQATINTTFDTLDGNLVADGDTDWASVDPPDEVRATDKDTGSTDDSFGQGTKEDTQVPAIVDGSIPNNKSDLLHFGVYFEDTGAARYLHLFWHRVQEPSGTTNMDFEFNQSSELSSNGVTPVRSKDDVLIQYDLAQGGVNPQLFISKWVTEGSKSLCEAANSTPCWGKRENLNTSGNAVGSINTVAIAAADSDGLGPVSARTFGEATIDFDAIAGTSSGCSAFAYAYLKSRSSDSFTAAAKDFIAPLNPGINNCGAVKVVKTYKHAANTPSTGPQSGVGFTLKQGTTTVASGTTDANGEICWDGLDPGSYTVVETVPSGYQSNGTGTGNNEFAVTVNTTAACNDATFGGQTVNVTNTPLTDITVSVNSQDPGGTGSTIDCHPAAGFDKTILAGAPDNGDGSYSMTNLAPGTYTCTVVVDP